MNQLRNLFFLTLSLAFLTGCYYDNKEDLYQYIQQVDCTATAATFATDVDPILATYCQLCHSNSRQDGNVNLEGYQNVKPYVENGKLYGTMNHDAGFLIMPTSGVKVSFCELEKVRLWIANGALND
ncbi:MAG: hypothetical protein KDC44_17870 [Phaeodactylibacter sp.]|nr:hypothetical protein [Phaeodactylibacter sp.]